MPMLANGPYYTINLPGCHYKWSSDLFGTEHHVAPLQQLSLLSVGAGDVLLVFAVSIITLC